MDDFQVQVAARFTMIEFVLEVMLANNLAFMSEDISEAFKHDLANREGYIRKGPVDVDIMNAIDAEYDKVLANFIDKVSRRETEIRTKRS